MKIRILRRRGLGNTSTKKIKEYSTNNIEIIRNDKIIPNDTDLLIRWGCTSSFPSIKTLNKSSIIKTIGDKKESRLLLQNAGVSTPKTYVGSDYIENYPVIVRKKYHSQGKHLYFCNNFKEVNVAFNKLNSDYYISEYIKKDREFGVFIFNNRVWSVIEKVPKSEEFKDSIAWNVAQNTHKFKNINWSDWPINVCVEALKTVNVLKADFCRVDVIVKDNIPYVLELNSAHTLTSEYRQKTFTKCLDYYIENGNVQNELDLNKCKSYKYIIHPALRKNKLGKNL